jgi:hypothetical protein
MDPLSIASGIAGLITLAGTVLSIGYGYISSAVVAPKELRMVLSEVATLETILGRVQTLVGEFIQTSEEEVEVKLKGRDAKAKAIIRTMSSTAESFRAIQDLGASGAFDEAMSIMTDLQKSLSKCEHVKGNRVKNFAKSLQWPFKEKELEKTLVGVRKIRDSFLAAISIDVL